MSRSPRSAFAIAGASLALSWPSAARTDDTSKGHLEWSAPSECPTRDDLAEAIAALHPGRSAASSLNVTAEVTRNDDGPYRLQLVLRDRDGVVRARTIEGDTCREVLDAAVVVIVLASHGEVAGPREDITAPALPPTEASPAAPIVAPPVMPRPVQSAGPVLFAPPLKTADDAPSAASPSRLRPSWDLEALVGFDFASLPAVAPGFGVGASMEIARNVVELRALGWVPQSARLGAHPNVGGDIGLYVGAVRYCRSLLGGVFTLKPCGGIEAGALVASAVGVQSPNGGLGPWLSPEAGLSAVLEPTHHFALTLEVEGLAQIFRPQFLITAGGAVYQAPPVTARTLAGLHVRFP